MLSLTDIVRAVQERDATPLRKYRFVERIGPKRLKMQKRCDLQNLEDTMTDDPKNIEDALHRLIVGELQRGPVAAERIATKFIESQPELWESCRERLARERLQTLATIRIGRLTKQTPDPERQMPLPGFEHVPLTFRIGKTIISSASAGLDDVMREIKRYKRIVSKRTEERAALAELKQLAAMLRWFKRTKPVTVEEAILRQEEFDHVLRRRRRAAKLAAKARWEK